MDFLLRLERDDAPPLHSQIEGQIREAIRAGHLGAGAELPSTRTLAEELGVARGVVVESYAQLRAEGYLEIRGRGKTSVSAVAAGAESRAATPAIDPGAIRYDFHPGFPTWTLFHGRPGRGRFATRSRTYPDASSATETCAARPPCATCSPPTWAEPVVRPPRPTGC
jgi:GntR family transcriptional regulator / MocR family aminotransferase